MRLTDYYRLKCTLNYFCFKYLSDCFINLESVNNYDHYSTQTESNPEMRISFIERKYEWKLMVIILGLLLAENIQNLTFGESGERERKEQTLCTALKRLFPFSTSPTTGYVLDPKISVGNFNACFFIPQAFSTTSYLTVLYCS